MLFYNWCYKPLDCGPPSPVVYCLLLLLFLIIFVSYFCLALENAPPDCGPPIPVGFCLLLFFIIVVCYYCCLFLLFVIGV